MYAELELDKLQAWVNLIVVLLHSRAYLCIFYADLSVHNVLISTFEKGMLATFFLPRKEERGSSRFICGG